MKPGHFAVTRGDKWRCFTALFVASFRAEGIPYWDNGSIVRFGLESVRSLAWVSTSKRSAPYSSF